MRSSFCRFGDCVDVEFEDGLAYVQDSHGSQLVLTREEWAAFLAGVRNGEFDLPPASDGVT